jgi:hypothetical protein
VLADMPWGYLSELAPAVFLGPPEEVCNGLHIGAPGMGIADQPREEFLCGEDGVCASAIYDLRQLIRNDGGKIP